MALHILHMRDLHILSVRISEDPLVMFKSILHPNSLHDLVVEHSCGANFHATCVATQRVTASACGCGHARQRCECKHTALRSRIRLPGAEPGRMSMCALYMCCLFFSRTQLCRSPRQCARDFCLCLPHICMCMVVARCTLEKDYLSSRHV